MFHDNKIGWHVTNTGGLPITISRVEISWCSSNELGESTFHPPCSDNDMNDALDCGKREGNGKGWGPGFLNDWLLESIVDSNETLNCTP